MRALLTARELARTLRHQAPAVYFVDDTRQDPAFDAEAIGRGNSRMRDETALENTRLSEAQCARLRETGPATGLLR